MPSSWERRPWSVRRASSGRRGRGTSPGGSARRRHPPPRRSEPTPAAGARATLRTSDGRPVRSPLPRSHHQWPPTTRPYKGRRVADSHPGGGKPRGHPFPQPPGSDPGRRDESAGPHEPEPNDRRDREGPRRRRGPRPPMWADNSHHVIQAAHRRAEQTANAPSPLCGAWTPPASASPSIPSPSMPRSPDPDSTHRKTCAPRSGNSASGTQLRHRRQFPRNGSRPRTPPCFAAWKRLLPGSGNLRLTASSSVRLSPERSGNVALPRWSDSRAARPAPRSSPDRAERIGRSPMRHA